MHCWRLGALGRGHQLELVDARHRRVEEAEPVIAALDLHGRVCRAVDREDVPDDPVVREVLEEGLAPPLGMLGWVLGERELAHPVVEVLVHGDAVVEAAVEAAVVDGQRHVVLDVEGAVRRDEAGQASNVRLVQRATVPDEQRNAGDSCARSLRFGVRQVTA